MHHTQRYYGSGLGPGLCEQISSSEREGETGTDSGREGKHIQEERKLTAIFSSFLRSTSTDDQIFSKGIRTSPALDSSLFAVVGKAL
ncbi:unnamed protein product [Leuciscus chuanchicus]